MKEYYYVRIVNPRTMRNIYGVTTKLEVAKQIERLSTEVHLKADYIDVSALPVLKDSKPLLMFCEKDYNMDGYAIDCITGNRLQVGSCYWTVNEQSPLLTVSLEKQVPASVVANVLRNLTRNEIQAYKDRLNTLERAVSEAYYIDQRNIHLANERDQKDSDFIQKFRKNRFFKPKK